MKIAAVALSIAAVVALSGCSRKETTETNAAKGTEGATSSSASLADAEAAVPSDPERHAYFGNLHVHTSLSFDAFTNGSRTTPEDAYGWAQGAAMTSSGHGDPIQLKTPLDFYMVSDHAEMLGVFRQMTDPSSAVSKLPIAPRVLSEDPNIAMQAFSEVLRDMSTGKGDPALLDPVVGRTTWSGMIKAADAAYKPGRFTTFAGFEWTSNPEKKNLHRVVVFRDTAKLPVLPLSAIDSGDDPEALWKWMDVQRAAGATLLAIPHNGNASDGRMFELTKFDGKPIDAAYIAERSKNEPLYEISQIKGTSETHPDLSPNDEFAGFEQWDYTLSADFERPTHRKGSFYRQALLDGMAFEQKGQGNPFKYGVIGDSDTHNAAASQEEFNYSGKFAHENIADIRLNGAPGMPAGQVRQINEFSSGGIAGVWAEKNTRGAIYDALLRKETFGTSGPLIRLRFFGGWDFTAADVADTNLVKAGYARGVPMGSDLSGSGKAPTFLVMAMKDPKSGNLDRVQIVKGWLGADGKQHEKVYDVVWSGNRKPGAGGKLPAVGNTVDVAKATYENSIGEPQLAAVWTDPQFDAGQRAFYYARVIEIPTPRWSTYDAVKLGVKIPAHLPATIQERAWSSPIWYAPTRQFGQ